MKARVLLLAVVLIPVAVDGRADTKPLRIAYAAIAGSQAPVWMLKESGRLASRGIPVDLVYVAGARSVTAGLLSGEIQLAVLGTTAIVRAYGRGAADLVLIGGVVNNPTFSVMVHPSIGRAEDLRGKPVAITRFGGSVDFLMRWFLKRSGLEPVRDVPLVQVGDVPSTVSALEKGSAMATVIEPPGPTILRKRGFKKLVDIPDTGIQYQFLSLATTRTFAQKNEPLMKNLMAAYRESIADFKANKGKAFQVLEKYLKVNDKDALADVYETYRLNVPDKGEINLAGIRTIIAEELTPQESKGIKAEDLVDLRFAGK
ncbi:MAG TPA: ABC transporter substrate-binding protein [candidate division Zixibacteria bacterium]|nr:ABC transporter substrate-binding protein [candidate division Zixibacteria bacterium]